MSKTAPALKRVLLGRPVSTGRLEETLMPKFLALPIFSSDALSSVAYATQEVLLVLGLAGTVALSFVVPISVAVALLLAVVVASYRQTVRAYPAGGGAYTVARENLGLYPGLLAASALMIDYVMTVAVSVVAGVDAIVSALPALRSLRVEVAVLLVLLTALANLRGVRESGTLFAIPVYLFMLSMLLLIGTGLVRCLGGCPVAASAGRTLEVQSGLGLFIVLRAFAAGTTALTGVEAIANGVTAFRYPQSRNAARTLTIMGAMSISMFLGISFLARHTHVVFTEESHRTLVAQVANAVFGDGPLFYLLQIMTATILVLAANTAFAGFPRLASILAKDRFLPRQFLNLGDRLVFSNGVILLSLLASLLIYVFDANLNHLIQLYLVGVFVAFTLSQCGLVLHWKRSRANDWRRGAVINGVGGLLTGTVLIVVVVTKLLLGAWIVVCAAPLLIVGMRAVNRHYEEVAAQLSHPARRPPQQRPGNHHVVIFVSKLDEALIRAVAYLGATRLVDVTAVAFGAIDDGEWRRVGGGIPLEVLPGGDSRVDSLRGYLRARRRELPSDDFLTVIIPEVLDSHSLLELLRRPGLHRLKATLVREPGVQVMDMPLLREHIDERFDGPQEPTRNYCCVLISGVNNAALRAVEYAETLRPSDIRVVSFGLDPEATESLAEKWLASGVPHPLEIEDSPFRDIGRSLVAFMRQFHPDGIEPVVTIIIPEFVVSKRRHQVLHGQTALVVKRHMLFELGVVVVSVPYHVLATRERPHQSPGDVDGGWPGRAAGEPRSRRFVVVGVETPRGPPALAFLGRPPRAPNGVLVAGAPGVESLHEPDRGRPEDDTQRRRHDGGHDDSCQDDGIAQVGGVHRCSSGRARPVDGLILESLGARHG